MLPSPFLPLSLFPLFVNNKTGSRPLPSPAFSSANVTQSAFTDCQVTMLNSIVTIVLTVTSCQVHNEYYKS